MASYRTKEQATLRLMQLGVTPGYVKEEEAAAYHGMSVGAFRKWCASDPTAPKPLWLGGCKRFKLSDLDIERKDTSNCATSDPIMVAIDAIKLA